MRRLKNLSTLLEINDPQLDQKDLSNLIDYVIDYKNGTVRPRRVEDIPAFERLQLLEADNFMRMVGENFKAENEGDTVY
ncbi:MAG TPA: hypothetical protein VGQ59_03530 [Cyclobacteriaceae bacterium]|nr:hypothetical protein [Cyclobacteriaceae bacterium]